MGDCTSTKHPVLCGWLQTGSQLAIAAVFVYAGLTVNTHMQSWTEAFNRGSDDLHSMSQNMDLIRKDMDELNFAISSIDNDMEDIKIQLVAMNSNMGSMSGNIDSMAVNMNRMTGTVGQIRSQTTGQGIIRGFMPF